MHNIADLDLLMMHNRKYCAEVAHNVSTRSRKAIVERADQVGSDGEGDGWWEQWLRKEAGLTVRLARSSTSRSSTRTRACAAKTTSRLPLHAARCNRGRCGLAEWFSTCMAALPPLHQQAAGTGFSQTAYRLAYTHHCHPSPERHEAVH